MSKRSSNILRYTAIISSLVIVGKVLGFIKQSVIAWAFGADSITDIYFAADGFISTFAQILSMSVAPTVLTQYIYTRNLHGDERADQLVKHCFIFFGFIGLLLSLLSVSLSLPIASLIGISYTPDQKRSLALFLIGFSPVILFSALSGVAQGYLGSSNRYAPGRMASLFFSAFSILAVLLLKDYWGIKSLLVGFLVGYFLHTAYVLFLVRKKIPLKPSNPFKNEDFRLTVKSFLPLLLGVSIVDFGQLADRIIASSLQEGSLSIMNYGQVVSSDLVNSVLVTALGTVLLTSFTSKASDVSDKEGLTGDLSISITSIVFLIVLILAFYLLESDDLVSFLFVRGNFSSKNAEQVEMVAMLYSIGFLSMGLNEILIKAFYAFRDLKIPLFANIIGFVTNVGLSVLLSRTMGVAGIALATSISMILLTVFLSLTIKRYVKGKILDQSAFLNIGKALFSGIVAFGVAFSIREMADGINEILRLFLIGFTMALLYFSACYTLGERSTVMLVKRFVIKNRPANIWYY